MVENDRQLADILAMDNAPLSLKEIESIIDDDKLRKKYTKVFKGKLYSRILLSLTHETYTEEAAEALWKKITAHRAHLKKRLMRDTGIVVACLDYLLNIRDKLSDPKIIEENKSDFISDAFTSDTLTGLYNREVFDMVLRREIEKAKRKTTPVCLLMIDLDDFKSVNDTFGHQAGDRVLSGVGTIIRDSVRRMDFPARYGGEELTVILPETDIAQGLEAAERIRKRIELKPIADIEITVSIGLGYAKNGDDANPEALVEAADKGLYQAKEAGKNRVSEPVHWHE